MRNKIVAVLLCLSLLGSTVLFGATAVAAAGGYTLVLGDEEPLTDITTYELPARTGEEGQIFAGWRNAEMRLFLPVGAEIELTRDLTLEPVFITMTTTAELRMGESAEDVGIRFVTALSLSDMVVLCTAGEPTFGTVIAPVNFARSAGGGTGELLAGKGYRYLDVKTDGAYGSDGNLFLFAGSVDRMLPENFARAYLGVGYIGVTYSNGATARIYAPTDFAAARSIYTLASDGYCDRSTTADGMYIHEVDGTFSPFTAEQRGWLREYLDRVVHIRVSANKAHTVVILPDSPYYSVAYTISSYVDNQGFTLTVDPDSDFSFLDCVAFMDSGVLRVLATEQESHNPITRVFKYRISEDGKTLYYYYSDHSPSF